MWEGLEFKMRRVTLVQESKVLTAHGRNAERRLGRVLEVVEPGEGIVVVRGGIHEVGVLSMVEDVLDVGGLHCGGR